MMISNIVILDKYSLKRIETIDYKFDFVFDIYDLIGIPYLTLSN